VGRRLDRPCEEVGCDKSHLIKPSPSYYTPDGKPPGDPAKLNRRGGTRRRSHPGAPDCHLSLLTKGEARENLHGFKAVYQVSQAVRAVLQGEENRSCRNNFAEIR